MTNKKNEKDLKEKPNFLIWLVNPVFMFFYSYSYSYQNSSDPEKKYYSRTIDLLPTMTNIEFETHSTSPHIEKIETLKSYFMNHDEDGDYLENLDDYGDFFGGSLSWYSLKEGFNLNSNQLPVLCLTFIYSLIIATDDNLRGKFYDLYHGRVPGITQYLLNTIRIGPLDNNYYVNEIILDNAVLRDLRRYVYEIYFTISPETIEYEFAAIIIWFKQLELLFTNNNLFFAHFVELEKTPLISDQKLTLTGFNQNNAQFLSNSNLNNRSVLETVWFHLKAILNIRVDNRAILETMWFHLKAMGNTPQENSKLNKDLLVLNKAVNANLVLAKDYTILYKSGALIGGDCQVVKNEAETYELASQLVDLIGNCNPNILKT